MKKIIGIVTSQEKRVASYVLGEVLKRVGKNVSVLEVDNENFQNINDIREDIDILILEINLDKIGLINKANLDLDILIDNDMTLDEYKRKEQIPKKTKLISNLKENSTLIINADNNDCVKISSASQKPLVITYGLNKKSSVTISSLDTNYNSRFNFCLQREIKTISEKKVKQFEYPIEVRTINIENIYSIIALISASIYMDIEIERLSKILSKITLN